MSDYSYLPGLASVMLMFYTENRGLMEKHEIERAIKTLEEKELLRYEMGNYVLTALGQRKCCEMFDLIRKGNLV
jgi:predicted transcriptional regulator